MTVRRRAIYPGVVDDARCGRDHLQACDRTPTQQPREERP
jgi:hypothetical protein